MRRAGILCVSSIFAFALNSLVPVTSSACWVPEGFQECVCVSVQGDGYTVCEPGWDGCRYSGWTYCEVNHCPGCVKYPRVASPIGPEGSTPPPELRPIKWVSHWGELKILYR